VELTKVRMKENFGMVTSDTSTTQFSFLVSPLKNRACAGKGDYVVLDHPVFGDNCQLLAEISDIKRYEGVVGASSAERAGKMIATADTIGYVDLREDSRPLCRLLLPPYPGSRIYLPYAEFLEDVFFRDIKGKSFEQPIHIGKSESWATSINDYMKQINVYINAKDLTKQHTLISAIEGAGKTHTATVIVEELANKTKLPIVIIDPYGEYNTICTVGEHTKKPDEEAQTDAKNYPFNFTVTIYAAQPDRVMKELNANKIKFGENQRITLREVSSHFSGIASERIERENKEMMARVGKISQITILNCCGLAPEEKFNFSTFFTKSLLRGRIEEKVEPFFFLIEDSEILAGDALEITSLEGKKIGISMCLVSKHPTDLGAKVLSQMGIQMIGRTTDANDLEYLRNMVVEKATQLPQLRTGEFILNGLNFRNPTKTTVRERYSGTSSP
jgi:DNA helicase HerA-like ATPase